MNDMGCFGSRHVNNVSTKSGPWRAQIPLPRLMDGLRGLSCPLESNIAQEVE